MSGKPTISTDLTILEIVHSFPETQPVFSSYDRRAGRCILCKHLFETLGWLIDSYGLDKRKILCELARAASGDPQVTGSEGAG